MKVSAQGNSVGAIINRPSLKTSIGMCDTTGD